MHQRAVHLSQVHAPHRKRSDLAAVVFLKVLVAEDNPWGLCIDLNFLLSQQLHVSVPEGQPESRALQHQLQ